MVWFGALVFADGVLSRPYIKHFGGKLTKSKKQDLQLDSNGLWKRYVDGEGRQRVVGLAGLRDTQCYPVLFCRTLAEKHLEYTHNLRGNHLHQPTWSTVTAEEPDFSACTDWPEASLSGVAEFLAQRSHIAAN